MKFWTLVSYKKLWSETIHLRGLQNIFNLHTHKPFQSGQRQLWTLNGSTLTNRENQLESKDKLNLQTDIEMVQIENISKNEVLKLEDEETNGETIKNIN